MEKRAKKRKYSREKRARTLSGFIWRSTEIETGGFGLASGSGEKSGLECAAATSPLQWSSYDVASRDWWEERSSCGIGVWKMGLWFQDITDVPLGLCRTFEMLVVFEKDALVRMPLRPPVSLRRGEITVPSFCFVKASEEEEDMFWGRLRKCSVFWADYRNCPLNSRLKGFR